MLGQPTHDPHGDPDSDQRKAPCVRFISTACSRCPLATRLRVMRIADQDPRRFLRFIESNNLKPGQSIEVESA